MPVSILMVPAFALLTAFLVDDRGDVRASAKGKRDFFRKGELEARRRGESIADVPVDERMYEVLRRAAAVHAKSRESLSQARQLWRRAEGTGDKDLAGRVAMLCSHLEERDRMFGDLEASVRALAVTTGRQRMLEGT